jgi:DNA polymerase-3 subunit gamma/tau
VAALHDKYRPTTWEEVIGQDAAVDSLKKVVKNARAHTFLFTGPAGTGKTTLARILANALAGGHATVANIEEFDAATNSGAEAIRAVAQRTLYRAIGESPIKAVIIDECHGLSAAAWKTLLKPTEEPPKHVYWLFCSTEPGKIPKPMQTRCLRYDLKPVPEEGIVELLIKVADAEKFETPDDVLEAIAENSEGSPRQALVYLEACHAENAADALRLMRSAGQTKEIIDLCRFLVTDQGRSWASAIKLLKAMGDVEAESCRIVIVNYLAKVLLNTSSDKKAAKIFSILECFSTPYQQSDKLAPLLHSVGLAISDV